MLLSHSQMEGVLLAQQAWLLLLHNTASMLDEACVVRAVRFIAKALPQQTAATSSMHGNSSSSSREQQQQQQLDGDATHLQG